MIVVGITGSVGMGKTTIAGMFAAEGAAVCNADALVHSLYNTDKSLIEEIGKRWPDTVDKGFVHRQELSKHVLDNDAAMKELEALIHPRVAALEEDFVNDVKDAGIWMAMLDIPLLFETGAEKRLDYVVVASAPAEIQRLRVLARPKMDEEKFAQILSRQMPDAEKRKRADFIIETGIGMEDSLRQVRETMAALKKLHQEREHYA